MKVKHEGGEGMKKTFLFSILLMLCLMFAGCGEEVTFQYKVLENGTDCEILGSSDNTIKKIDYSGNYRQVYCNKNRLVGI